MPFGLSSSVGTLMRLMNHVLHASRFDFENILSVHFPAKSSFSYSLVQKVLEQTKPKVKAIIQEWPTPTSIANVRSFHCLASFYRHSFKVFSALAMPLTKILKKKSVGFHQGNEQENVFNIIKDRLKALILALPNFNTNFEIESYVSGIGIEAILKQNK